MPTLIKDSIEMFFGIGLFVNAVLFIPQFIKIWKLKKSENISILTFSGFNVIQILTILHAYIHEDKILFIGTLLALITCGSITIFAITHRRKNS